MNTSVIKFPNDLYIDVRDISSINRFEDIKRNWTIINVKGVEHFVDIPIEEVLRMINWQSLKNSQN